MRRPPARKGWVCSASRAVRGLTLICLLALPLQSCERKDAPQQAERSGPANERTDDTPRDVARSDEKPTPSPPTRRITAAWYPVPPQSLAKRRAPNEFTAAHNKLPLGTRVRVTNPDNGRTLVVRITDRGIRDRRVKLDVCKEAAEELGMVRDGLVDLKMQVLPEEEESAADGPQTAAAAESDHLTRSE